MLVIIICTLASFGVIIIYTLIVINLGLLRALIKYMSEHAPSLPPSSYGGCLLLSGWWNYQPPRLRDGVPRRWRPFTLIPR